jgi:ribosomal-protein-alanine N-acetyltransferase
MTKTENTSFPVLITEHLVLRQPEDKDIPEIVALRSNTSVNQYLDRPEQTNADEARTFIQKINDSIDRKESLYWAICLKGETQLIGTICLWNFSDDRTTAELGFELTPGFQGKGLMNEVVGSVIRYGIDVARLTMIDAFVHKDNKKSIRLLVKNNFKQQPLRKDENDQDMILLTLSR